MLKPQYMISYTTTIKNWILLLLNISQIVCISQKLSRNINHVGAAENHDYNTDKNLYEIATISLHLRMASEIDNSLLPP